MPVAANQPEAPTAIHTDLGAIFVSLELSRSKWLITSLSPGRRREDVEAFGGGWRRRRAAGAVCRAQQEGRGADRAALSDHRDPGGRPRRLLDPPRAAGRRDRKPRRRSGVDCDLAPAAPGEDRRDRRRGAGARAAGLQAGRTAGVCDGPGADARGRRPPSSLARAQGLDERARAARQPHQRASVQPGRIRLRAAASRPARATGGAADRRRPSAAGASEGADRPGTRPARTAARADQGGRGRARCHAQRRRRRPSRQHRRCCST